MKELLDALVEVLIAVVELRDESLRLADQGHVANGRDRRIGGKDLRALADEVVDNSGRRGEDGVDSKVGVRKEGGLEVKEKELGKLYLSQRG